MDFLQEYVETTNMNRYITLGILVIIGSFISSLEMEIAFQKQFYDYGEPIIINITVTNETEEVIKAPVRFVPEDYYIKFKIVDKYGNRVSFKGLDFDIMADDMDIMEIPPKSQFTIPFDISRFYNLKRGVYAMMAYYYVSEGRFSYDVWSGRMVSNQVNIGIR